MTIEEMRARKKELGYSNKKLAELSGVPLGTLQKIFSGATAAPRYEAIAALERVLGQKSSASWHASFGNPGAGSPNVLRESPIAYGNNALQGKKQGEFTLDDYYALPDERRVELIDGVIYDMAAPSAIHQELIIAIAVSLKQFVKDHHGTCRVYVAPFDVQLDRDNRTMVQPDIVVICQRDRLKHFGCYGAPDLVMEVLSPSTAHKDLLIKLQKYMAAGVSEYWLVNPDTRQVTVYRNLEEGLTLKSYNFTEKIPVGIWNDQCVVDFGSIYEDIAFLYDLED